MEQRKKIPTEAEVKDGKTVESTKPQHEKAEGEKGPKIKRGNLDSLSIYEISEGELTTIERGSSTSIYLNFAIFLLSVAVSLFTALLTGDFENNQIAFIILTIITVCGVIIGGFLLILWFRKKDDFDQVIKKIKERMEEE